MDNYEITGGNPLRGEIRVSGAKNVAMKVILCGLLTNDPIIVRNTPLISSVYGTCDIVKPLGVKVEVSKNHTMKILGEGINSYSIPLELGGKFRTATMVIGPLLARFGKAIVPNPGGCRLGKRPIDRHVEGLEKMGAKITYKDGFFICSCAKLKGARYKFQSNTHTGTETLILAAVLAEGETVLQNAAEEPEIDDLINLLAIMGAKIKRKKRTIVIKGVKKLTGAEYKIMPDRNEVVTFAVGALASRGDVVVRGTDTKHLDSFLNCLDKINASWKQIDDDKIRFWFNKKLKPINITTSYHPGFMTDWQAPWSLLMTQIDGLSKVHETIYEDRFGYVKELQKMGAKISFFNPKVTNPKKVYNFNWNDRLRNNYHAIKIRGPVKLHNAVLEITDLRAGATLILAASIAKGKSVLFGIDHIDRGYENIEERLKKIGVKIKPIKGKI